MRTRGLDVSNSSIFWKGNDDDYAAPNGSGMCAIPVLFDKLAGNAHGMASMEKRRDWKLT